MKTIKKVLLFIVLAVITVVLPLSSYAGDKDTPTHGTVVTWDGLNLLLAGLEAVEGTNGMSARLVGRVTANDGGEGWFVWDASVVTATYSADILKGIYVYANRKVTDGCWVRQDIDAIYPEWFGIDGTDDHIEINAALQFKANAPKVILGAKTYNIAGTITRGVIGVAGEFPYSLIGSGVYDGKATAGTRLNWVGGNNDSMVEVSGYAVVKNINLLNGNGATGIVGFDCSGLIGTLFRTNGTLENLMAKGLGTGFKVNYYGYLSGTRLSAYYCGIGFDIQTEANSLTFTNCAASRCGIGVTDRNGQGSRSVTFNGLAVEGSTTYGLDLGGNASAAYTITSLYTEGNARAMRLRKTVNIQGAFINEKVNKPILLDGCAEIHLSGLTVRADVTQLIEISGSIAGYAPNSLFIDSGLLKLITANSIIAHPELLSSGILHPTSYTKIETPWLTTDALQIVPASVLGENFALSGRNPRVLAALYLVVETPVEFTVPVVVGVGRTGTTYVDYAKDTFSSNPLAKGVYSIPLSSAPVGINWYSYAYNYYFSISAGTGGRVKLIAFII